MLKSLQVRLESINKKVGAAVLVGAAAVMSSPAFAVVDVSDIQSELGEGKTAVIAVFGTLMGIAVTMFVYHLIQRPLGKK